MAYYAAISLAVLVLGISKTGFGGGTGILAIPLMALVMPAQQMIAVLALLLVAVDLLSSAHYLGEWDWGVLGWMLPGAVIGVGAGMAIFLLMRQAKPARFDANLSLTIGIICLLVVLMQLWRWLGRSLPTLPRGKASGTLVGVVAGTVSTLSHSAGPIVMLYMLQERLEKRRLVGTLLMFTLSINCVKLACYVAAHTVTRGTLYATAWTLPLLPVGTLAGAWMNKHIDEKPFVIVMYIAAAATAVQLIYKGMS